jgi:hypothetical protein
MKNLIRNWVISLATGIGVVLSLVGIFLLLFLILKMWEMDKELCFVVLVSLLIWISGQIWKRPLLKLASETVSPFLIGVGAVYLAWLFFQFTNLWPSEGALSLSENILVEFRLLLRGHWFMQPWFVISVMLILTLARRILPMDQEMAWERGGDSIGYNQLHILLPSPCGKHCSYGTVEATTAV